MSVKLDESIIDEIKKISSMFKISYSDFIRNAVQKELEEKKKDFIYRLSEVEYCSQEEEKEILDSLSKLSKDDLTMVKTDTIKI